MIYLDTHLLLWLYDKELHLFSSKVRGEIEKNDLYISPVVQLELQFLKEKGRIRSSVKQLIDFLQKSINLKICNKDFALIIAQACEVDWTRDPFDRIIVAHAALNKNKLLTRDQYILRNYPLAAW